MTNATTAYVIWWHAVWDIVPDADGRDEGWEECYDAGMTPAEAAMFMEEVGG